MVSAVIGARITRMLRPIVLLLAAGSLCACANSNVVRADGDTFVITKRTVQVGSYEPDALMASAYEEASTYCLQQARSVETVKIIEKPSGHIGPAKASIQFRCVVK